MRRLLLIRHTKSSWKYPQLCDHDRPLNKRGLKDAPLMVVRLLDKEKGLEIVASSTATRALGIAQPIAEALKCPLKTITELYTFSSDTLLHCLYSLSDDHRHIAIVGHNPDITEVAGWLTDHRMNNVPTSGVVAINTTAKSWPQLHPNNCQLDYFDYPKNKSTW